MPQYIPLFRIDVPLFSESIQFGAKTTKTEPDDKVKLRKIFRLPCLPPSQHLGSRKILKVFMICNNVDGIGQTFQVVLLNLESFKDSKQFLVIHVIVQLHHSESVEVKGHWMNFIFFVTNGKDCSKSIVQSISFHDELNIKNPISKNRGESECFFERIESITPGEVELPKDVLLDETCQWNDNVQIIEDEPAIKISKT